ncbi:hypothetical protein K432DRAFT_377736 [Lepidopterella palustris CBS 459.81]|uniref:Wax synthase domain-containing protein n=1 Tax=Lepidopterella palustris CBS 459.81 TaxID=1314670 RepID=A0A8E2EK69_9PEZI|nr:hypothetical protein K432DRAFT_377736 [Lepidopterella palustris CBS 459.81]
MPFGIEKIRWAIALWMNPRGIGWSHQIKRVPRPLYNNNQKWAFILGQLRRFGTAYIVADACILFTSTFKFPDVLEHITWENKTKIGLASGLLILSSWQMQWTFVSILGVASRLSDPEDWPPFFGAISELATVKAFWGSYWHQVLHEVCLQFAQLDQTRSRFPQLWQRLASVTLLAESGQYRTLYRRLTYRATLGRFGQVSFAIYLIRYGGL